MEIRFILLVFRLDVLFNCDVGIAVMYFSFWSYIIGINLNSPYVISFWIESQITVVSTCFHTVKILAVTVNVSLPIVM